MIDWSVVEAAHAYADKGWAVLPLHAIREGRCTCGKDDCAAPGKHPRVPHGVKDASREHDTITHWFEKWPESNIGIATGKVSGVSVVDIDPRNGGFESMLSMELTETQLVETGSGGLHYYYHHFLGVKQHVLAPGVDLKSNGGYVVAPPSNHVAGSYRWINEDRPIAEAPPICLNGRAHHPPKSDPNISRNEDGSLRIEPDSKQHIADKFSWVHGKGFRHPDLISLAGYFIDRGHPKAVTEAVLTLWGRYCCDPPLEADWVSKHVEDCYQRYYSPEVQSVDYWTAQTLLDAEFPDLSWVVENLLPEGLVFLAGRPKRGKSWAALQIAVDVVSGRHSFGPTTTGKVIYIALEDSARRVQSRLKQMNAPRSHDLIILNQFPRLDEGGTAKLLELIEEHKPILVVIDTFSRAVSSKLDANEIAAITEVLSPIQSLALRLQVCVLLVDHHRKPGDNPGDMIDDIAGSTAKVAVADAVLGLYRKSTDPHAVLKLTGRDVEEREIALRWDSLRFRWIIEEGSPLTSTERSVLDLIRQQGKLEAKDIAREVGLSERTLRGLLFKLRESGHLHSEHVGGVVGHPRFIYSLAANGVSN